MCRTRLHGPTENRTRDGCSYLISVLHSALLLGDTYQKQQHEGSEGPNTPMVRICIDMHGARPGNKISRRIAAQSKYVMNEHIYKIYSITKTQRGFGGFMMEG